MKTRRNTQHVMEIHHLLSLIVVKIVIGIFVYKLKRIAVPVLHFFTLYIMENDNI